MQLRWLTGAACALALHAFSAEAKAWNFPEHAELMRLALDQALPSEARASLERAMREVAPELGLCRELTIPLAEFDSEKSCVPFSVLTALAGDHSIDVATLRAALTKVEKGESSPLAQRVTRAVVPLFAQFVADAPPDVARLFRSDVKSDAIHSSGSSNDLRRTFLRKLDIRVNALDSGYASRAEGSRAHFQDATRSMDDLLRSASVAGDFGNALAQVMAHHARSLQFAADETAPRRDAVRDALLEHALAVHFLQDAFAAGHIGTEPAVVSGVARLRRHDFLNRVGLSVTRTFSTHACQSPLASFADADGCWIAYGDGYLDWNNARLIAEATSRLTVQLAMALDRSLAATALARCRTRSDQVAPNWVVSDVLRFREAEAPSEQTPNTFGVVRVEGPNVVHVYTREIQVGERVSVAVSSEDFDTFLQVRLIGVEAWRNDDANVLTTNSRLEFEATRSGTYEIKVSGARPDAEGSYRLEVGEPTGPESARDCSALVALYERLDPAPPWSLAEDPRRDRERWTDAQKQAVATLIVQGAQQAIEALRRTRPLRSASADGASGALPGALSNDVLGSPLEPCVPTRRWVRRTQPLCRAEGSEFRFGAIDASLWRPVLVIWPGPSGDVRIVEGEDSFGYGVAAQVIFGAGGAVGFGSEPIPWAIAPFFGGGLSLRVDSLFPSRVNRELLGADFGFAPAFPSGLKTRYAMLLFLEGRLPLWSALGAWLRGREWSLGRVEFGPTGFRAYWELPARLPDGPGRFLGWDVEVLNIRLNAVQATRTASIGSGMDTEFRLRVGTVELDGLDGEESRSVVTVGAEVAGGYSVFLTR